MLGAASLNALACYTVYDSSNRVVYQGESAPVDMSLPLHQALQARFPGSHMVFDTAMACMSLTTVAPIAVASGGTPLLTNTRMARAMNVPHTEFAGGIALVQPGLASARPGVTVVPAETVAVAARARNTVVTEYRDSNGAIVELVDRVDPGAATRMMGAGPAPRR